MFNETIDNRYYYRMYKLKQYVHFKKNKLIFNYNFHMSS